MNTRFRRRSLAALLLDQSFVAGLGNYLRSEILHFAQLHPNQQPQHLSEQNLNNLANQILRVTRQAYETAGVTNRPETVVKLKSAGLGRNLYRFAVFDRRDQPCYSCANTIERHETQSRRIYLCPTCQRPDS